MQKLIIAATAQKVILVSAAVFCLLFTRVSAQSPASAQPYPLDPLTATEMQKVVQILKDNHLITGNDYFNIINLKEPPKKEVLAYKPGDPFRREAYTSFYDYAKPGMTEAVVDLNAG